MLRRGEAAPAWWTARTRTKMLPPGGCSRKVHAVRVLNSHEEEPTGRRRGASEPPVAGQEDPAHLSGSVASSADLYQCAGDVPHHVLQKRAGFHGVKDKPRILAVPAHDGSADLLDGGI